MTFGRYACGAQSHTVRWGSVTHKGRNDLRV